MTFAAKLKAARKRLKLSQPEAADLLGISFRAYWGYENDESKPAPVWQEGALARLQNAEARKVQQP